MSIQALILVPDPYYNEPGLEQDRGSSSSKVQAQAYIQRIREATIRYAMIGHLKSPPVEFADVVRAHFKLKRPHIAHQCAQWLHDAKGNTLHHDTLTTLARELNVELDKLA
jgi:baculoviral IAP repeat-containing protein 6